MVSESPACLLLSRPAQQHPTNVLPEGIHRTPPPPPSPLKNASSKTNQTTIVVEWRPNNWRTGPRCIGNNVQPHTHTLRLLFSFTDLTGPSIVSNGEGIYTPPMSTPPHPCEFLVKLAKCIYWDFSYEHTHTQIESVKPVDLRANILRTPHASPPPPKKKIYMHCHTKYVYIRSIKYHDCVARVIPNPNR